MEQDLFNFLIFNNIEPQLWQNLHIGISAKFLQILILNFIFSFIMSVIITKSFFFVKIESIEQDLLKIKNFNIKPYCKQSDIMQQLQDDSTL